MGDSGQMGFRFARASLPTQQTPTRESTTWQSREQATRLGATGGTTPPTLENKPYVGRKTLSVLWLMNVANRSDRVSIHRSRTTRLIQNVAPDNEVVAAR
jgi:hypothetical protein